MRHLHFSEHHNFPQSFAAQFDETHKMNAPPFCERLAHNGRIAVDLAEAGFFIFPVFNNPSHPYHKRPLVNWRNESTNCLETVKAWWSGDWRHAMPGIDLSKSNLVVLDGDRHSENQNGSAEIEKLLQSKLSEIGCPVVVTPSGGVHAYFIQPQNIEPIGNSTGNLPSGVDVRGCGGFTIAPGAATGDKKLCRRLPGTPELSETLHIGSIPYLPSVIVEAIQAGKPRNTSSPTNRQNDYGEKSAWQGNRERAYAFAALEAEANTLASTLKGGRNAALNVASLKLARQVVAGRLSRSEVFDALCDACKANGLISDDGKSAFEKTFQSGFSKGLTDPAPPLEDRDDFKTDPEIERLGREAAEALLHNTEGYTVDPETGEIFEPDTTNDHETQGEKTREQSKKSKHLELETVCAASLAGKPVPEQQWLIPDMIPASNVTILSGDGATGKSLLALQLAVAVATGGEWLGWTPQVGRVAYVSAEDELDELHRRLDRMIPDLSKLGYLEIVPLAGKDAVLAAPVGKEGLLSPTPLYAALRRVIDRLNVDFLVLDTLADLFGGDEIRKIHARCFIAMLRRIALEQRVTIILLSHPSLSGMARGDGTSGNVAWNNSVRSRLYFERRITFDGQRAVEEDRDIRILSTKKNNRAPNGGQIQVRYDRGQFVREHKADPAPDAGRAAERVFLTLLELYASQGRDVSPSPSTTYAPAVFEKHPRAEGHTKRAFQKAMDRLLDAGKIEIEIFGPLSRQRKRLVLKRPSDAFEDDTGGES